jgi:hypothetical protein
MCRESSADSGAETKNNPVTGRRQAVVTGSFVGARSII